MPRRSRSRDERRSDSRSRSRERRQRRRSPSPRYDSPRRHRRDDSPPRRRDERDGYGQRDNGGRQEREWAGPTGGHHHHHPLPPPPAARHHGHGSGQAQHGGWVDPRWVYRGRGDSDEDVPPGMDYYEARMIKRQKRAHFTLWANTPSPHVSEDEEEAARKAAGGRGDEAPVVVASGREAQRGRDKKASRGRSRRSARSSSSPASDDDDSGSDKAQAAPPAPSLLTADRFRAFLEKRAAEQAAIDAAKAAADAAEAQQAAAAAGGMVPSGGGRGAWGTAPAEELSDAMVGPQLPPSFAVRATDFGRALLPGEGDAMAQYVAAGKRIPRRGEVGLRAEEISKFEDLGYVMSGSRHARMNAIRIRKENQVYTAEEKAALAQINFEEQAAREAKVMDDLRRLVQKHLPQDEGGS